MTTNKEQLKTPVLVIIFNRPDKASLLLEKLREVRPNKLFIAADGPRENKTGERDLCEKTRNVFDGIDWQCEVKKDFLEKNIGCDERVPSAINWFFENTDKGIILEDDCIPNSDFFYFCEDLLNRYQNEEKVMMISGNNFQDGHLRGNNSYYFSKYPNTWGFATWKRAWQYYDHNLDNELNLQTKNKDENRYWTNFYNKLKNNKYTFWDAKWLFSIWHQNALSITSNYNLVTNIGFGKDSTHTKDKNHTLERPLEKITTIIHPEDIEINEEADRYLFEKVYKISLWKKILNKIKLLLKI